MKQKFVTTTQLPKGSANSAMMNKLLTCALLCACFLSCKKDKLPEPELKEFHVEVLIYSDTVYHIPEATYIELTGVTDTNFLEPYYDLLIGSVTDTLMYMDSLLSLKMAYIGGCHNPEPETNVVIPVPPDSLPPNTVIIYDTVYATKEIYRSYAIISSQLNGKTSIDTLFYQKNLDINDISVNLKTDDMQDYLTYVGWLMEDWGYTTDKVLFNMFISHFYDSVRFDGLTVHLIDLYPAYNTDLSKSEIMFYLKPDKPFHWKANL